MATNVVYSQSYPWQMTCQMQPNINFCSCIDCQNNYYNNPQLYFSQVFDNKAPCNASYPYAMSPVPSNMQPLEQQTVLPTGEPPLNASFSSDVGTSRSGLPHRLDLGYESQNEDKDTESHHTNSSSRPVSPCDSARPESPDDVNRLQEQVEEDLAGFRMSGARPVDMALSQKMELVWHGRFNEFFSRFDYARWYLFPVFDPPDLHNTGIARNQWRYFKDQAKVRFICNKCQKAWTSMGGQVVFWIYKDDANNVGYIHFKLYGQKCSDCSTQFFEHAIWYQEEVEKVIENLFHHVGELYYGMNPQKKRVDRRLGHPKKEHNCNTCQACAENICRMGQSLKKKPHRETSRG